MQTQLANFNDRTELSEGKGLKLGGNSNLVYKVNVMCSQGFYTLQVIRKEKNPTRCPFTQTNKSHKVLLLDELNANKVSFNNGLNTANIKNQPLSSYGMSCWTWPILCRQV